MSVLPIKLFFDGGCRPNPGKIEGAVVRKGVVHYRHDLGEGDNSDAEWLAAIHALEPRRGSWGPRCRAARRSRRLSSRRPMVVRRAVRPR
ncbi:hypothetical protein QP162_07475 [Sphingomonas aurantiaca]|uniref:ribonuclease HI n=1 Tax=Sphingomonas aurantiaca TaxID=185949 RepID=UPI002FE1F09D